MNISPEQLVRRCEQCNSNIVIKEIAYGVDKNGYYNCITCWYQIAKSNSRAIQTQNLHKLQF